MSGWKWPALVVLVGLAAILLQGSVLRGFLPEDAVPNLLLVVVVFVALHEATILGASLVFVLGLLLDLSTGLLVGPWAGAFIVVFGVLASLSQRIFVDSSIAGIIVVFLSSIAASTTYLLMTSSFKSTYAAVIGSTLLEAVITALVAWPVIRLLRALLLRRDSMSFSRGRGRI